MTPSDRRRRRHGSVSLPVSAPAADRPPLSALFLIDFDVKAGYTIAWRRALPELELDGLVEYKSLPSGLHTVSTDLIYFVHDAAHAGLSAFVNEPCQEAGARHARMIAVGVLVPLSYGRLGRAWRHASSLEHMAAKLAKNPKAVDVLDRYWQANRAKEPDPVADPDLPPSPSLERRMHGRGRSASDGMALHTAEQNRLSPYHPAWSLTGLLDRLGPLIFPIYRAALLRRRILISCHAPVRDMCHLGGFTLPRDKCQGHRLTQLAVYDISILSNIPVSVADSLPASSPTPRLTPLFAIGVHDIPFLAEHRKSREQSGAGWIACTTDSILAVKDTLWDMLITMPTQPDTWPSVECPRGNAVKATQRDLRRYNALRAGLARLAVPPDSPRSETPSEAHPQRIVRDDEPLDQVVEPPSWASLAYNGYMWWASAGEQLRSEAQEESGRDAALLADMGSPAPSPSSTMSLPDAALGDSVVSLAGQHRRRRRRRRRSGAEEPDEARVELAIIAYFHRLTAQMLSVLAGLVDDSNVEEAYAERYRDSVEHHQHDGGGDGGGATTTNSDDDDDTQALLEDDTSDDGIPAADVTVSSRCVDSMGLDVWSSADAAFIQELVVVYFGREARVEGKGVEVCGVRVC